MLLIAEHVEIRALHRSFAMTESVFVPKVCLSVVGCVSTRNAILRIVVRVQCVAPMATAVRLASAHRLPVLPDRNVVGVVVPTCKTIVITVVRAVRFVRWARCVRVVSVCVSLV